MIIFNRKAIFTCLMGLLSMTSLAQAKYTISGFIKDKSNGEGLIGASVYIKDLNVGVSTNSYGFYSITLPEGSYTVTASYVTYQTETFSLDLKADITRNIALEIQDVSLNEVVVTGERGDNNLQDTQMSVSRFNMNQIRKLPTFLGQADLIKVVQMQPGVITAGEGTSSFFVRGGSADQNLILIDEAPIYDPSHLFGLISVFNGDVVKDAELYKGGIPARYGSRLSSILDVRTKDGNNQKFALKGGIGFLAANIAAEGPFRKDKSSWIVSARSSYVGLFLQASEQTRNTSVGFYDVNAKANWKLGNKDRLFVAFYLGKDYVGRTNLARFGWGNQTGTLRWNHLFTDKWFMNTTVVASQFDYRLALSANQSIQFDWTSYVRQFSVSNDHTYYLNPNNELSFGYQLTYRMFNLGLIKPSSETSIFRENALGNQYALDQALYADNSQKIGNKFSLRYGLRLSIFQPVGPMDVPLYKDPKDNINVQRIGEEHYGPLQVIKTYVNLEPRFSALYLLNETNSVKLSYNRMVQNTHLVNSSTVPLPFNTWIPSNYYVSPQTADQVAVGYVKYLKEIGIELTGEIFYKKMNNVTNFTDNADVSFNTNLPTVTRQGKSVAYGFEFGAQKKMGNITGFLNYTLSRVTRQVEDVNNGKEFYDNFDRRNVINLALTYDLNPQWSFGLIFNYATGRPITLPVGSYTLEGAVINNYTDRNAYRLPDYHRMDIAATWNRKIKPGKRIQSQWVFSIYNVYNRKNPFTVYINEEEDLDTGIVTRKSVLQYLFPFIPQVTYNFKF